MQALEQRDSHKALAPLKPLKTDKPAGLEPAPEAVHLIAEAERLTYADRAQYVADSDFVPVPVKGLVDPDYLASRAGLIGSRSMGVAKPGTPPGIQVAYAPDRSPCASPPRKWWRWMTWEGCVHDHHGGVGVRLTFDGPGLHAQQPADRLLVHP